MIKQKKIYYLNKGHTDVCLFSQLKYIRDIYNIEFCINNEIYSYPGTINSLINYLCNSELKDSKTVIKITKKLFKLTSKVPIYIRKDLILLLTGSLKNENTEILNYSMIDNIYNEQSKTLIIFKDGTKYTTNTSYKSMKNLMSTCEKIDEYFKKRA